MQQRNQYVHPVFRAALEALTPGLEPIGTGPLEPATPTIRICGAGSGAPAGATASERDDSSDGKAAMSARPTSGPEATSSQGDPSDDDLAPLVTADDLDLDDLRWQRGCDWMTERDVQMYESGHRARDFFR